MNSKISILPPVTTTRWTPRRKLALALSIKNGTIDHDKAMSDYGVSHEELTAWETLYAQGGSPALRSTKLQTYRRASL